MDNRQAKRARALKVRDAALALLRARGKSVGFYGDDDNTMRIAEWSQGRLQAEYLSPRYPDRFLETGSKPKAFMLTLKLDGVDVFKLGWNGERLNLITYQAGRWEELLLDWQAA